MTSNNASPRQIAVVGMGPRGTAVVERLVAASMIPAWQGSLTVHCIDPHVGDGGAVWRRDQPAVLLMNTTTAQTTQYPDASTRPLLPTPHQDTLATYPGQVLGPTEYSPRAGFGEYLAHVLDQAEADADPSALRIVRHRATAVDVSGPPDGPQTVRLDSGARLRVDAVALCLGHLPTAVSARSEVLRQHAEEHDLLFVGSANPLDVTYRELLDRERIAVQGMGLNFYDLLGMLTHTAGGRFEEDARAPGGLRYHPGGGEPQLVVGSRSGMLYRPKPVFGESLPEPYEPVIFTSARVVDLAVRPQGIDHLRDVRPLMLSELEQAMRTAGFTEFASTEALLSVLYPLGRQGPVEKAHARTRDLLELSIARAAAPDPVWMLMFRVITALRIQVNRLIDLGAYTTESLQRDIDGYQRNAFASWASGPPLARARQLLALVEAGLVHFTGPGMKVECVPGAFRVDGLRCDGVFEAHLPPVNLDGYTSPLMTAWKDRGEVSRDSWMSRGAGKRIATGSIAVDGLYHPVGSDGAVYGRRYMLGVPVSTAQPGSAISAEPGSSAQLLRHAENVALRLARHADCLDRARMES